MTAVGMFSQFGASRRFNGGLGLYFSASTLLKNLPSGIYRLRCIIPSTSVKLWDNTAASGTVLQETVTMTAGQTIQIGQITTVGVYATVVGAGGLYVLIETGTVQNG
jgi:hypothetical protein